MDYIEALKQVKAEKPHENYLLIKVSWNFSLVLPYKDGIALMATLAHAEQLEERYNEPPGISPLEKGRMEASTFSRKDYERHKIAMLLRLTLDEVKKAEEQASQPETTS